MLTPGDLVLIDSNDKLANVVIYTPDVISSSGVLVAAGQIGMGTRGMVLSSTAAVPGEDRYVRVLFPDDKVGYVSEKFVKKV
jgi:hypothetical protein